MKKLILFLLILIVLIAGCVDNTKAIQHCDSLGLQYTGKKLGCDVQCINATTGQLYNFAGDCKISILSG